MQFAEVVREGAMMNAKTLRCDNRRVQYRPLKLHGPAIVRTRRKQCAEFLAPAPDAEGPDRSSRDGILQKTQQSVIAQILRSPLVQQPPVDAIRPQLCQAALQGLLRLSRREACLLRWLRRLARDVRRPALQARKSLHHGTGQHAGHSDQALILRRGNAVLRRDRYIGAMPGEKFSDATLRLAKAIHRGDVEMTDTGVECGLEQRDGLLAAHRAHQAGAPVAEACRRSSGRTQIDSVHRASANPSCNHNPSTAIKPAGNPSIYEPSTCQLIFRCSDGLAASAQTNLPTCLRHSTALIRDGESLLHLLDLWNNSTHPFDDQAYLPVVVVSAALGPCASRSRNPAPCCFIRKVATNLLHAFVNGREEHCLLVLDEALHVTLRAFRQKEALARRNLKTLMRKLVLVGVGKKTQVDLGFPYPLAVCIAEKLSASAIHR